MKFLVDRCAGRRVGEWLRSNGHDVIEAGALGPDPGDLALLRWAEAERRIVVTIDMDFGKLVFAHRTAHCGIVRLPDVPSARRILLLEDVLLRHGHELESGAIITVRGGKIRISKPPFSSN